MKLFYKKGIKKPDKFIGYIKLTDAFKKNGCPVCTRIQESTFDYINSLLYENVNDPGTREELKSSFGLCAKHSQILRSSSSKKVLCQALVA